jgi:hypothetical protein
VITLGSAAFRLCPEPVTLTLEAPIVAVGTPFCVTEASAPGASAAKPTEAGFAPEDGVDILEELVSNDPPWPAAGPRKYEDGPDTLAARGLGRFKVVRGDGPCLAAERDRDVGGRRVGCGGYYIYGVSPHLLEIDAYREAT